MVIAARRSDRLSELAESLGERVLAVQADLTDPSAREHLINTAAERGSIDILVNNAGYGTPMAAEVETMDHYHRIMDINVHAVHHLCILAGAHMIANAPAREAKKGASIVNIASVLGLVGAAPIKEASYCAAKGAVVNLTRALGAEWGRKGVRVNAIAPGWFPSEMTQEAMFDDESGLAFINSNTPMGRGGDMHELDGALLFLAGDASSYVTGQTIAVDGGWVAR